MLRDVTEGDLPTFFEHQCDPLAKKMAEFPGRERDAFMAHWRTKVLAEAGTLKKTIVVDREVAGHVVSWEGDGKRLVGYWVGRKFWGRGVASSALKEFLACETTRPLFAYVAARNVGSIRVLQKCGFRPTSDEPHAASDGVEEFLYRLG